MRCLCWCVCLYVSVCLSRSWILSKRINISSIFSPSGSQAILVFPYQTLWQYSDGNSPNGGGGIKCRWGRQKSRFWTYTWLHCVLSTLRPARFYQYAPPERAGPRSLKLWHLSLVGSGGVCWWRETSTKCLWQEVSTLHQRQQNSI